MTGEEFADTTVGHKEELIKSVEKQGIGFKVATITILKNWSKLFLIFENILRPSNMQMQSC